MAALYLAASTLVATTTGYVLHRHSGVQPIATNSLQKARYLVLIVLDGARPDYFDLKALPHVDALRARGTQFTSAMTGILESETPSGHTTIATGSTPAHNGILGFDWAQNDNDFSVFSPDVVRAGAIEHIMQSARVPTIASMYKAHYPTAKVVALSGHKYYAADPLGGPAADAIMYYQGDTSGRYVPVAIPGHVPPAGVLDAPGLTAPSTHLPLGQEDTLATRLALETFKKMRQRITLINYPEFDWPLGHVNGGSTDSSAVTALMQHFDQDLSMIEDAYRQAGVLDQTLFVITADHGMAPISRFVPETVFTRAVSQAGTTAPAISYSTGTYVWLADAGKARTVAENIMTARDPGIESTYYLSVAGGKAHYVQTSGSLSSTELQAAHLSLLNTLLNGHEPSVVAFLVAGQTSADPSTHWKGDHGGADWESQHIPLIFSGAGAQAGVVSGDPAQLQDVAPTALAAMGVRSTGMQGQVLTEVAAGMGTADMTLRQVEINQVSPIVNALISQHNSQGSH